jgi:two-component system, NtrC family, response regulator HydG
VLETAVLTPLGGDQEVEVDVRVVAATSCDLRDAVANGRLRETLLHRLAIFPIAMPPLRERGGDVELLAEHFLTDLVDGTGGSKSFTAEAVERLRAHPWPGNVRELKSAVHHAFILAESDGIGPAALPEEIGGRSSGGRSLHFRVGVSIAEVERELMLATLRYHDGNKRKSAEVLGVSLKTLYNRLNAYKDGAN